MSSTDESERDKDLLAHLLTPEKSQWPGAAMFIAFLIFVYFMTALFVQ